MTEPASHTPLITSEDVYDRIHQATWRRRTASLLGGATIGVIAGGLIGLLAAFIPPLLVAAGIAAAAPPMSVLATVGAFAGAGCLLGFAALTAVGGGASAVAAGLAEMENRQAAHQPGLVQEIRRDADDGLPPLFKWRAAVLTVPLAAAFGALLAATGVALEPATLGFAAQSVAAVASSAIVFGMFGSLFAQPFAYYTNKLSNFYLKVITGRALADPSPAPQKTQEITPPLQENVLMPELTGPASGKRFAPQKTTFSFQDTVEKNGEQAGPSLRP